MTEGPIRASEVAPSTEKSPEEKRREAAREAVRGRLAAREGIARAGGDLAAPSDDLATRLERSKAKVDRASTTRFKAQKAVEEKMNR
jgi:hypothetical protein